MYPESKPMFSSWTSKYLIYATTKKENRFIIYNQVGVQLYVTKGH